MLFLGKYFPSDRAPRFSAGYSSYRLVAPRMQALTTEEWIADK
jgi:hypothetical protein